MGQQEERVSESEVGRAVLWVLAHAPGGEATVRQLIHELPDVLELSAADCAPSPSRRGEQLWEQQVRNLVSHRETEGNVIAEGYIRYFADTRKLKITSLGRAALRHFGYDSNGPYSQA